MIAARPSLEVADTIVRAERAARLMAANGYSAVRTHVDTTIDHGLRSVEALIEVRRRVADVVDIQVVAMAGWPVTGPDGAAQRQLLLDALALGADVLGGCPHLDPAGTWATTETLLAIAAGTGSGSTSHRRTLDPTVGGCRLAECLGHRFQSVRQPRGSLGMQPRGRAGSPRPGRPPLFVALPGTTSTSRAAPPRPCRGRDAGGLSQAGATVAAARQLQDPFNPSSRLPVRHGALMISQPTAEDELEVGERCRSIRVTLRRSR